VAMLAVMAVAGLYVFNEAMGGGEPVTVPNVVGMSQAEAQLELAKSGLTMGTPRPIESEQREGSVLSQRPEAGDVIRAGRKVYPTISTGAVSREAPDVVGMTMSAASEALARAGLSEAPGARIRHSRPRGTVLAQDPPAGLRARNGEVRLLVSDGPTSNILMPDIVGKSLEDVQGEFRDLDIEPVPIRVSRSDAPYNEVLEQMVPAGSVLAPGDRVAFRIRLRESQEEGAALNEKRITYIVPHGFFPRTVRAQVILPNQEPESIQLPQEVYEGGTRISPLIRYPDEATVEFFVDGKKHKSYYLQGQEEPVVTTHIDEWSEDDAA